MYKNTAEAILERLCNDKLLDWGDESIFQRREVIMVEMMKERPCLYWLSVVSPNSHNLNSFDTSQYLSLDFIMKLLLLIECKRIRRFC